MSYIAAEGEQSTHAEILTLENLALLPASGTGQFLRKTGLNTFENATPSEIGLGTVTKVSVVSTNGFSGTVALDTTTPQITIQTTITGIIKGNGTAISAATDGTDYLSSTTGLKLDQTTPQTIINGIPVFDLGLDAGSSVISGVSDPILPTDAVNLQTLEQAIPAGLEWYLSNDASADVAGYKLLSYTNDAGQTAITVDGTASGQALEEWVTVAGSPGAIEINDGDIGIHFYAKVARTDATDFQYAIRARVYRRTSGGVETQISGDVTSVPVLSTTATLYSPHIHLVAPIMLSAGERILVKLDTVRTGTAPRVNAQVVTLYIGSDTSASHLSLPVSLAILDNYVPKSLYDAHSVLYATTDDTPVALTVGEQTLVGRLTGGNISAVSIGIADNNILQVDDASAADNDYAKFTANGLEGVPYATVLSDIGAAATSQTFYIGTTQVAINRTSAALTLAGITLTTPDIGVATATSVNKLAITAPATGSTLAVADGKTFTVSNTLTLTATDGATLAIGAGGTLGTGAYATIANYATLANPTFTGTVILPKTIEIQDTSADHQYVLAVSELTADRTITLPLLTGTDTFVFQAHTQTLTNKRITNRVVTTTDDSTAVINVDTTDVYELSAVANATTFSTTGTPTDGQTLMIRFKDAGVAKGLTWDAIFVAIGVTAPTTTVAGKWHYVGCTYNTAATKWHIIATGVQA